jgi:putative copper resistance protein D
LSDNTLLLLVEGLHQFGAAIWIGGIPCFILVLGRLHDADGWRLVGARFSRMSMLGVGCIVVSGAIMSVFYIGSLQGFYGTAYGVMVGAKIAMFLALLALGFSNFLVTERLRKKQDAPVIRLRRFAEIEIGIGFTIFFAAASLTSVPPAVDLTTDRVSLHEIAVRNAPAWPRFSSPDHDQLAVSQLQARLDDEAANSHRAAAIAIVPGSGILPPRNAQDIAWSEYNHHWAGIFVLLISLLALLNRAGVGWAKHWPLLFIVMAAFLLLRSDPEVWPLGSEGFWAAWRDVEVAQHRFFVLLILLFGVFEWAVRTGRLRNPNAALVFPLLVSVGGAMLLTHTHQISNVKDQLLIELTHTPLALSGVAAGWARWLELRLPGRGGRIAGWVWPVCFLFVGIILLWYREA